MFFHFIALHLHFCVCAVSGLVYSLCNSVLSRCTLKAFMRKDILKKTEW